MIIRDILNGLSRIVKWERWDADFPGILNYTIEPECTIDNPIKPPEYELDSGYDLGCSLSEPTQVIPPHGFADIPAHVRIHLPRGLWADVRARSSTFAKRKLLIMNSVLDCGYRGPLSVFVFNPNSDPVTIHRGDYLAQLVLMKTYVAQLKLTDIIPDSQRSGRGFGSSGGLHTG